MGANRVKQHPILKGCRIADTDGKFSQQPERGCAQCHCHLLQRLIVSGPPRTCQTPPEAMSTIRSKLKLMASKHTPAH
eukprot:6113826-Amphidinium_carterae.1